MVSTRASCSASEEKHPGPGRREGTPDLGAVAGVAGVLAEPERGVSREREQRREPHPRVVHDLNSRLSVAKAHVDVEAEDNLLFGHPALPLQDLLVAVPGGYGLLTPVRERVGARGGDADALLFGGFDDAPAQPEELLARPSERTADRGEDLELRGAQLGHDPVLA